MSPSSLFWKTVLINEKEADVFLQSYLLHCGSVGHLGSSCVCLAIVALFSVPLSCFTADRSNTWRTKTVKHSQTLTVKLSGRRHWASSTLNQTHLKMGWGQAPRRRAGPPLRVAPRTVCVFAQVRFRERRRRRTAAAGRRRSPERPAAQSKPEEEPEERRETERWSCTKPDLSFNVMRFNEV